MSDSGAPAIPTETSERQLENVDYEPQSSDERATLEWPEYPEGKEGPEVPWQKLSPRMLLVDPLGTLTSLLPVFVLSLWLGSTDRNYSFQIGLISLVVGVAVWRWLMTTYRIGPTHIELRKGFFTRKSVRVRRERVRSVDVESGVFHRLLGVSILDVGTGKSASGQSSDERFQLNAIRSDRVGPLRDELLIHARRAQLAAGEDPDEEVGFGSKYGEDLAHWRPSWSRFAPMSWIGFGVLFSLWFLTWQMGDTQQRLMELRPIRWTSDRINDLGQPWTLLAQILTVWAVSAVLAIITYAIRYGKYALTDHGSVLYVQNGILRRKHQALDRARLRGVEIRRPLLLRILGGGRLQPIMTGTKSSGSRASTLLPQAPYRDVIRVAERVVGDPVPVTVGLRRHGSTANWRRFTRGLMPFWFALFIAWLFHLDVGAAADQWSLWLLPPLLVLCLVLAIDRVRMLGHAVCHDHLVTSHGSLSQSRAVLAADGIIGWTVTQSFFQRRGKLCSVHAATPAGGSEYTVIDMPIDEAWTLVEALTPGITSAWGRFGDSQNDTSQHAKHRR